MNILVSNMESALQHQKKFIRFIDRNYCIAAHLTERLDELRDSLLFSHLREPLSATIRLLEDHTQKTDELYATLGTSAAFANNLSLIAFLEHSFSCLPIKDDGTQYLCLLDYVSIANTLMAEGARLAERSLSAGERLGLPMYQLYNAAMLEPLTTALTEVDQEDL